MLKRLLLTAALLPSTYGATTEYFDPDFSLLANRSEELVVNENGATINPGTPDSCVLRRLTQADVSKVFSSDDFDVLADARSSYNKDIGSIQLLYIVLTADSTPRNGYSKAQEAEFLSQLFWKRVSLFEQTLQIMIDLSSTTKIAPPSILKQHQAKLAAFSMAHNQADTTLFTKGHYQELEKLMDEFTETCNPQHLTSSTDE